MSVDGGLIDNEPFEYARRAIMRDDEDDKPDESCVRGAVLMIDPFPEPPAFSLREMAEASMFEVARAVFPMLKNQVRFKPDALATALNNDNYSRWMISPSRTVRRSPDEKEKKDEKAVKNERYAIATGVLGGFGGFLDDRSARTTTSSAAATAKNFCRHLLRRRGPSVRQRLAAGVPEQFQQAR